MVWVGDGVGARLLAICLAHGTSHWDLFYLVPSRREGMQFWRAAPGSRGTSK